MGVEMVRFFLVHSIVDLITNSSTELFVVDVSKNEGFVKELFEFLANESGTRSYEESEIVKFSDYRYKDDYIIDEDTDIDNLFACDIGHGDGLLEALISKYFNVIELDYKDD